MSTLVQQEVRERLGTLLPAIVASRKPAPRSWKVAATAHFYSAEVASVLIGWGITTPLVQVIGNKETTLSASGGLTIAIAVLWTLFVLWLKKENVADRLAQGDACRRAFLGFEDELHAILAEDDYPPKALRHIAPRLKEAKTQYRPWFFVDPNSQAVADDARKEAVRLVAQFGSLWRDPIRDAASAPRSPSADVVQPKEDVR